MLRVLLSSCIALTIGNSYGQAGANDPGFEPGAGANGSISDLVLQPDGKILIGGNFDAYDGTLRNFCARLDTSGALDPDFDPGAGTNAMVNAFALQPDGRILIVGLFTTFDGSPRYSIARLLSNGGLDPSFNHSTGANAGIQCIALQPDGKILIGGWFTAYDGVARNHIARLNADGGLDTGFDPGSGASDAFANVYTIAVQADGRIVLGGYFATFNGAALNSIARLNADGSLDTGFNPGTGADNNVWTSTLQPDGKILISGDFATFNGVDQAHLVRLNTDGSVDPTFNTGTGANNTVWATALQPDGKILIGGGFWIYDDVPRLRVARLLANGDLDTSFDPGSGTDNLTVTVAVQPDGRIVIGGSFDDYNGAVRHTIARILLTAPVGIGETTRTDALHLSPNPVTHALQLTGRASSYQWSITDTQGRLLLQGSVGQGTVQAIDVSTLSTGGYVLVTTTTTGAVRRTARFNKW